jgi:hypothetical protein
MFAIDEQECKMHFTSRSERNGEEVVPAGTLKLSFRASNDILSEFGPDMKSSLYKRPDVAAGDLADKADTRLDDPNYLPKLKFPEIKSTIKLDHKVVGATVTVYFGTRGKSNIVLDECLVDNFELDPQEGALVVVSFNVAAHPTEGQFGKLCMLQDQFVTIKVAPPTADQGTLLNQEAA